MGATVQTVINVRFIRDELVWKLQLTLNELNQRAGFGEGYIYQLLREDTDPKLSTIDRLWTAAMVRYAELGINPPDDLWDTLIEHRLGD